MTPCRRIIVGQAGRPTQPQRRELPRGGSTVISAGRITTPMTSILLVDSDLKTRERIAALVRSTAAVSEARDAASAAEALVTGFDLVIVRSSETLDGGAVVSAMRERGIVSPVMLVVPELTPALATALKNFVLKREQSASNSLAVGL